MASQWASYKTDLCHNVFTLQVDVIPQILSSLQTKKIGFLCSKKVDIAACEKKMHMRGCHKLNY